MSNFELFFSSPTQPVDCEVALGATSRKRCSGISFEHVHVLRSPWAQNEKYAFSGRTKAEANDCCFPFFFLFSPGAAFWLRRKEESQSCWSNFSTVEDVFFRCSFVFDRKPTSLEVHFFISELCSTTLSWSFQVDRDDLADQGAAHVASTVRELKQRRGDAWRLERFWGLRTHGIYYASFLRLPFLDDKMSSKGNHPFCGFPDFENPYFWVD